MTTSRWEKERASWLLARSRPGSTMRRRAEVLARKARRLSRSGSGLSESSVREDITPPLMRRMLATSEGPKEQLARLVMVPLLFVIVGALVGPAMLIAAAIYALLWQHSPKIGRLHAWPWFAAGGVLGLIGLVVITIWGRGLGVELQPPLQIIVYLRVAGPIWLWVQTVLGLAFTGVQVTLSGWAAVPKDAGLKPTKDADGNFIATPEHKKVRLDPLAGVAPKQPDQQGSATAPKKAPGRVKLAAFTASSMEPQRAPTTVVEATEDDEEIYDNEPIFDEELTNDTDGKDQTHV